MDDDADINWRLDLIRSPFRPPTRLVGTTNTSATVQWPDGRVVVVTADDELYEVERVGAPR